MNETSQIYVAPRGSDYHPDAPAVEKHIGPRNAPPLR